MTMRLNVDGKDRVMNERGITTKVRNEADHKMYWIGTTRKVDGTWITAVAKTKMLGIPGERIWEITIATSDNESIEIHFAVEEIVQKKPRDKWEPSLPEERLAARRVLDEAEKAGLFGAPRQAQKVNDSGLPGGLARWALGELGHPVEGLTEEQNRCRAVLQQYHDCLAGSAGTGSDEEFMGKMKVCEEAATTALAQISPEALTYVYAVLRKPIERIDQAQGEADKFYLEAGLEGCRLINAALKRVRTPS